MWRQLKDGTHCLQTLTVKLSLSVPWMAVNKVTDSPLQNAAVHFQIVRMSWLAIVFVCCAHSQKSQIVQMAPHARFKIEINSWGITPQYQTKVACMLFQSTT